MYTSYIGKKLLKLYNERNDTNLTPKEFFDSVQFPIFFDDSKHLMHVHGSTFFQKVSKEQKSADRESIIRLRRLHENVSNGKISASTYVGYAAEKATGVTSGQVSSVRNFIDEDEVYSSWIGAGLGVGIEGRYVFLTNNDELIWKIFEGWKYYRDYLSQTPNIKDKEVEFWNAWWLINSLGKDYNPISPTESLTIEHNTSVGETRIKKKRWSELMFPLSKSYYQKDKLTVYAYQLDKTNTTLGFINIYLKQIHELYELRDQIFIEESKTILSDLQIEQLETFYNFRSACQFGTIGLKSLEPAKLREFMPKGSIQYAQGKDFKFNNEESYINYKLFKIWIIAMLNKTELLQLASDIATSLVAIEAKDDRGKKVLFTLSKEVRESKNIKEFIEKLTQVLDNAPENGDIFRSCVEQVLKMPTDNFPLFITLIRFEYTYQKSKK